MINDAGKHRVKKKGLIPVPRPATSLCQKHKAPIGRIRSPLAPAPHGNRILTLSLHNPRLPDRRDQCPDHEVRTLGAASSIASFGIRTLVRLVERGAAGLRGSTSR